MIVALTLRVLGLRVLDLELALPFGYVEDGEDWAEDEAGSAVTGAVLEVVPAPLGFHASRTPSMEPAEWE